MGFLTKREKQFTDNLSEIKTVVVKTVHDTADGAFQAQLTFGGTSSFVQQEILVCLKHLSPVQRVDGVVIQSQCINDTKNLIEALNLLQEKKYMSEVFAKEIIENFPNPYPGKKDSVFNLSEHANSVVSATTPGMRV